MGFSGYGERVGRGIHLSCQDDGRLRMYVFLLLGARFCNAIASKIDKLNVSYLFADTNAPTVPTNYNTLGLLTKE